MSTQIPCGDFRVVSARVRISEHEQIVKAGARHPKGTVNAWVAEVLRHAVAHEQGECLSLQRAKQLLDTIKALVAMHDEWLLSKGQAGQYLTPSVRQALDEVLEGF